MVDGWELGESEVARSWREGSAPDLAAVVL